MIKVSVRRKKRSKRPLPDPEGARAEVYDPQAAEIAREYLVAEVDQKNVKVAAIWAVVFHFILFFIVIPTAEVEPIPINDRSATTIVKRYKPPAPPSRPKKAVKKKTTPVPIPDPTPDEPEPIFDNESDVEFDEPDADFDVGMPNAPPGPPGARAGAASMGDGGLIPPVMITEVLPEYTPSATRNGIQGDVLIEAVVTIDGGVVEPKLVRGLPDDELNQRALEAIVKWTFKPGMKDGASVPVVALFQVTYRIH